MAGVYNRKLFRQASARDELRKLGGIMASSEELMMEALRTASQQPASQAPAMAPPPPVMQRPAPMPMPMPMAPMPMAPMPMQRPMAAPMQPPMPMPMQQPMPAEAPYMPAQVPQSAVMASQPAAFNGGGPVGADQPDDPYITLANSGRTVPVDISQTAGTVVEPPSVNLDEDLLATAEDLSDRVDSETPEAIGTEIVDAAASRGAEPTGNLQSDLASIYANLTGDPAAYEKNIDALNRGILGAAIAAGTSARATQNIAQGMLVGLEAAKNTEERRVKDARALQLAQLNARAAAAGGGGGGATSDGFLDREPAERVFTENYNTIMSKDMGSLDIPSSVNSETGRREPSMSQLDYATMVGNRAVASVFTPEQLIGTRFEGIHELLARQGFPVDTIGAAPAAAPAPAAGTKPTLDEFLEAARSRNPTATDEQLTEFYRRKYGG